MSAEFSFPQWGKIAGVLQTAPHPVYLVGGAVRDWLWDRPIHDLDCVVAKGAIPLAFRVGNALRLPAYVLDQARDVGRVVFPDGATLDIAAFRYAEGGLSADLLDRDFTINALALAVADVPHQERIIDLCGGRADLEARFLRSTHPLALARDPIRALRGVRFLHHYQLSAAPTVLSEMEAAFQQLPDCTAERVRDELNKLLASDSADLAVEQLQQLGAWAVILPELHAIEKIAQSPPHHEAVGPHSRSTLRQLIAMQKAIVSAQGWPTFCQPMAPFLPYLQESGARAVEGGLTGWQVLRWGAMLHDVGKAVTQTWDAEAQRLRFLEHEAVGARLIEPRLRQLRFSNQAIKQILLLVAEHMRPHALAKEPVLTRRAAFRYFRALEQGGWDVGLLALADTLAKTRVESAEYQHELATVCQLFSAYQQPDIGRPQPLLDGQEIMRLFGLSPGREIGRLLALLLEAQAVGEVTDRPTAEQFLRQHRHPSP